MAAEGQINSIIVKINIEGSKSEPRFVVEEVTAQHGSCFEGADNLLRARFECLCCKTGYVVLPLIMQTAPIWTEIEVSIAENDPTMIQQAAEHVSEDEIGSTLNETIDSDEKQTQGNEHEDSEMEADTAFPMDVDADYVKTPSVKNQIHFDQKSDSEECGVLTSSEELSLKMQCLRSEAVIRLVRIDEKAREEDASVAPVGPQKRNVKVFYQCDICKASIKYRGDLTRHMNIHLGIRFPCSECPKSFNRNDNLALHKKRFHQGEFRICEVCIWSNTCTKPEYYSHLRRRHPAFHIKNFRPKVQNFNGVDFPCVYCEPQATFKNFEELKDHLKDTHERDSACTRCPNACTTKADLNRHIDSIHEKKNILITEIPRKRQEEVLIDRIARKLN